MPLRCTYVATNVRCCDDKATTATVLYVRGYSLRPTQRAARHHMSILLRLEVTFSVASAQFKVLVISSLSMHNNARMSIVSFDFQLSCDTARCGVERPCQLDVAQIQITIAAFVFWSANSGKG